MPVLNLSNNRVLPANQRASDVAARAVEEIADTQQQRINAAFRVQGVQAIVYHRLNNGKKCSCQSHAHQLNTRLDRDGNADAGLINELLIGSVSPFGTTMYDPKPEDPFKISYTGPEPSSADLSQLWNKIDGPVEEDTIGDNGVANKDDLDEQYNGFDPTSLLFGDSSCPICFGTGYVGGYSIYNGLRTVVEVSDMDIGGGVLDIQSYPFSAESYDFAFPLVLPLGIYSIDCFRLKNKWETVPVRLTIDGLPCTQQILKLKCDGRPHVIGGKFNNIQRFTHFEFQANLSSKSAYIELPKLSKSSRLDILDSTDEFQILLSPDVPYIEKRDLIADSMHGKILYVQNTTWLNTRERQMLGWEVNVRVVQEQESYFNLPRRKPIKTKNETVNPVIGNIGNRP